MALTCKGGPAVASDLSLDGVVEVPDRGVVQAEGLRGGASSPDGIGDHGAAVR